MPNANAQSHKVPTKIVVTNITQKAGGAGYFLDPGEGYGNKIIGPGRSMTFDCPGGHMPDILQVWGNAVTVHDASNGVEILGSGGGELSPGLVSPVREMAGERDLDPDNEDFLNDEEPSLDEAIDANMPNRLAGHSPNERGGPIAGDLRQQSSRTKVSLGTRTDEVVGGELSPIPGDRPRDLDNSQQYTIKAPRANHVGGIVGKK